jgi:hypothetical protein
VNIHCWLSEEFFSSQAAFGTTYRVTGGYRKAGISFLKKVTGRIVKTISAHKKLLF